MSTQRTAVSFSDLTHPGHSCNNVPYGLAMVAAYARKKIGDKINIEIFKDPFEFAKYLENSIPVLACFSNYIWNLNISYEFTRRIKERKPEVVIVFGGPNYPIDETQQEDFLLLHPDIDFYICQEGELAFVELFNTLQSYNFDVSGIKKDKLKLYNCHYLSNGEMVRGDLLPPVANLDEFSSPYLTGLCDKFLNGDFIPLMQTTRGCPFNCTYCQEGDGYPKDIRRFSFERIKNEVEYIAQHTNVPNLALADANFGMYKEDLETCKAIAQIQKKYGWPRYFQGIDGKNQKRRVLEAASIVRGSYLNAAVQSTDEAVLKNIKRENVSLSEMVEVAKSAELSGANSFSEVILCLPGDTKEAHFKSIFDLIDAGLNVVRSHQFIMLPGSEVATRDSRRLYEMTTRFRVVPNTVKEYRLFDDIFSAPEIDEICVANSTMPFEDYLECRKFNLTVEIFYNDGIFQELFKFLKMNDIAVSSFIMNVHLSTEAVKNPLLDLYNNFLRETKELWENRKDLESFLKEPGVTNRFMSGEMGNNEQLMYRAIALFKYMDELHQIAFTVAQEMLIEKGCFSEQSEGYLKELSDFSFLRKKDILSTETTERKRFRYDFITLAEQNFNDNPLRHHKPAGMGILFIHTPQQKELISQYIKIYGLSNYGLGNILSNASHANKLYRTISRV